MGNKLTDDILKWTLELNGNPLQKELGELESSTRTLTKTNKDLRVEKAKLEAQNKKDSKEWKAADAAIKKNNVTLNQNKTRMKELRSEIGLTGLSANQLKKRSRELTAQLNGMTKAADPTRFKKLETELDATNKQLGKVKTGGKKAHGSFTALKTLLPTMGISAAIAIIGKMGKALFDLSAEMQQNARKAKIVLGPAYESVTKAANENAKAMGLTNLQYRDAVTNVSDLLVPLDFTRKQAAGMATDVIGLAGAFSEWSSGVFSAKEVSEDLNKAILGEMEGLKKYGIAIRKDSDEFKELVKQKLEDGAATKAQAEALAAYELIMKKSADAQSAFSEQTSILVRKKKSISRFWQSFKEGSADVFSQMGKDIAYSGDAFMLLFNRMGSALNKFASKLGLNEIFDIEPITAYSNAILEGDVQFNKLASTVKEFGINTDTGAQAFDTLKEKLENVYGADGLQLAEHFYQEQSRLSEAQTAKWEAEEQTVLEANRKKLEAREQQETEALEKMWQKVTDIQFKYANTANAKAKQTLEEFYKEIGEISFEEIATAGDNELAQLEELEQRKNNLRRQYGLISLEEEKSKELDVIRNSYAKGLLSYEEYEAARTEIANYYRQLKVDQELQDEEDLTEKREIELEELEKDYENGLIKEEEYNRLKADIVQKYAKEEVKIQREKYLEFEKEAHMWGGIASGVLNGLTKLHEYQKQKELKAAGNNTKEKEKIEKKYAKKQQQVALKQAIINTALAVISGFATVPFMPAGLAAGLLAGVMGGIEIATINSQQFAKGKYDVVGADDGKKYSANYIGNAKTGIIDNPSLVSEINREMIIDNPTLERTMVNAPWAIDAIMANRVPQFASGNYSNTESQGLDMSQIEALIAKSTEVNSMLSVQLSEGIKAEAFYNNEQVHKIRTETRKLDSIDHGASRN
ncbi:MAG: hypothetical protein JEY96_01490 [Bacteroidales bacterium]|nr:hypothetical protein [Bacteroidales bacterium]